MKRLIAVMLAVLLIVLMAACDLDDGGSLRKDSDDTSDGEKTGVTVETEGGSSQSQKVTMNQVVLMNQGGIKITAKGLEKGLFGQDLKVLIENNSDKDLTVQVRSSSVNGYMVETMFSTDVVSGKKVNDSITFLGSDLERCGITDIADMEFSFHIFTTEDWDDYLDSELIKVKTSIADTYKYSFDDSGEVAYAKDGIKIVVKGLDKEDSIYGPGVALFIENRYGKDITVQVRNVSVNGYMVQTLFSPEVVNGKCALDSITFLSSDLEENEITEITEVELSFDIMESDTWDDIAESDTIKLKF